MNIIISQWKLKVKTGNLLEARENASDQVRIVLVLHLIGWMNQTDQSQGEVKQNQSKDRGSSRISFDSQSKTSL